MGEEGFEPPKAYASRFTVCPLWPLGYSPGPLLAGVGIVAGIAGRSNPAGCESASGPDVADSVRKPRFFPFSFASPRSGV